ncbi:Crp/Fnr family transcriptional regulator [Bacillus sp. CLL-7-23]|uniref:Crp/Fnr family transcriptional regulator n=1 Tax=Bacillus changyiensis TaxID=3004103 RepID=A0ABT4WYT5_9BACI|nr:Crp/Fnr family transcriptional regulator [Bacillus changyiensis]MDA7025213.1 Crp/Fnr family transcriptional regulator [Bacillus changyiensis]
MKNKDIVHHLKKFSLFASLSDKELEDMKQFIYWRTYHKGQILFMEEDPRERMYLLLDGFIKLENTNDTGSMFYIDYIRPHTLFPFGGLFRDEHYHYAAEALTDIELYYIPMNIFEDLIRDNPTLLFDALNQLSDILALHEERLKRITLSHAHDRVIQGLYYLTENLGQKEKDTIVVSCPITATEIAKISGTSRETVSVVLKKLRSEGVISQNNKQIIIHKPDYFK